MSAFDDWFDKVLINRSLSDVSKAAFNVGMERAAEIAESKIKSGCANLHTASKNVTCKMVAKAIRKEIK